LFHIATDEEIRSGKVTDVYFVRTLEILKTRGINKRVAAEVWTKGLPDEWGWAVFAGIEEGLELLSGDP
jgi:nicotinate phosphoribosyltransferase